MERILATHTGSLIRPPELLAFLAAKDRGQGFDERAYEECLRDAVADVVAGLSASRRENGRRRGSQASSPSSSARSVMTKSGSHRVLARR